MNKFKLTLIILTALILLVASFYYFNFFGFVGQMGIDNSRTGYSGYVKITSVSLVEVQKKLQDFGCWNQNNKDKYGNPILTESVSKSCTFSLVDGTLYVDPQGSCMGPCGIIIRTDRVEAGKDIPGRPNTSLFKKEVRKDIGDIGGVVTIDERSWHIDDIIYPLTVVY
jgi:hypothetical protein